VSAGDHVRLWIDPDYPRPDWSVPQPDRCGATRHHHNGTEHPKTPRCELKPGHVDGRGFAVSPLSHVGRTTGGRWVVWNPEGYVRPDPPQPGHTRKPSLQELQARLATAIRRLDDAQADVDRARAALAAEMGMSS
jgi:hypothetical protein